MGELRASGLIGYIARMISEFGDLPVRIAVGKEGQVPLEGDGFQVCDLKSFAWGQPTDRDTGEACDEPVVFIWCVPASNEPATARTVADLTDERTVQ